MRQEEEEVEVECDQPKICHPIGDVDWDEKRTRID